MQSQQTDLTALSLWLWPSQSLYYLLYYTDTAASLLVLACYLVSHSSLSLPSALVLRTQQLKTHKSLAALYAHRSLRSSLLLLLVRIQCVCRVYGCMGVYGSMCMCMYVYGCMDDGSMYI